MSMIHMDRDRWMVFSLLLGGGNNLCRKPACEEEVPKDTLEWTTKDSNLGTVCICTVNR